MWDRITDWVENVILMFLGVVGLSVLVYLISRAIQ